jgi:hypothetical protein
MTAEIERANAILAAKGYSPARLVVQTGLGEGRAILKGTEIVSPLSDSDATIMRVVEEIVPPLAELDHPLVPREIRARLSGA